MKVLMTIPLNLYRKLESECAAGSPRYNFLKNGLIHEDKAKISIRCDSERALEFVAWVNTSSPGAASQIEAVPDQ
jgi:hypothetical protein